jgi:hypothetical protein
MPIYERQIKEVHYRTQTVEVPEGTSISEVLELLESGDEDRAFEFSHVVEESQIYELKSWNDDKNPEGIWRQPTLSQKEILDIRRNASAAAALSGNTISVSPTLLRCLTYEAERGVTDGLITEE